MSLSNRFIHTALAFFVIGVGLGMYMGISHDFRFVHVHVHINLLGWMSLGLVGLLYAAHPALAPFRIAQAHYWLHTVGLVLFMGGFAWRSATGDAASIVPIAAGSSLLTVGVALLAVHVFTRLGSASVATPAAAR